MQKFQKKCGQGEALLDIINQNSAGSSGHLKKVKRMKQIFKKRMARALAVLLSVAMITCFVPQAGAQVYAENEGPVVGLTGVLETGANTDSAQTVYYGVNGENPIAWRVIKYKTTGNAYI